MDILTSRDVALKVAFSFLGKPYLWGGDDPIMGFDCSGFVIEILKSVGILPRHGDWTAQGLWDRFENVRLKPVYKIEPGCLVFWKSSQSSKIIHVEMCINNTLSIGASGGGSKTLTEADAIAQNAYIKVRPFEIRPNIAGFADPFKLLEK
jgi:cell wall-associated NlpC family hydrolase